MASFQYEFSEYEERTYFISASLNSAVLAVMVLLPGLKNAFMTDSSILFSSLNASFKFLEFISSAISTCLSAGVPIVHATLRGSASSSFKNLPIFQVVMEL